MTNMANTTAHVNKVGFLQTLAQKLETMPRDTLAYIQGAIDMAGMLEAKNQEEGKAG